MGPLALPLSSNKDATYVAACIAFSFFPFVRCSKNSGCEDHKGTCYGCLGTGNNRLIAGCATGADRIGVLWHHLECYVWWWCRGLLEACLHHGESIHFFSVGGKHMNGAPAQSWLVSRGRVGRYAVAGSVVYLLHFNFLLVYPPPPFPGRVRRGCNCYFVSTTAVFLQYLNS